MHFEQWEQDDIEVRLILKGGGCENKNIQYSLPADLDHMGKAGRDLEGVRKCLSARGVAGAGAGVRSGGGGRVYRERPRARLRPGKGTIVPHAGRYESDSGVGQAGSRSGGGSESAGHRDDGLRWEGVVDRLQDSCVANRLPASFFVSVAYECWAFRRLGVRLDAANGAITKWLYRDPSRPVERMTESEGFPLTGREIVLRPPISEEQIRALKVGDVVLITGELYTGRDAVHAHLMKNPLPDGVDMRGAVLYHCGPVMLKSGETWTVKAAGPTTSIREEPYQAHVIKTFGIRAVMGKGGMGAQTLAALKENGAVYLNAIGGAAQYYARSIDKVLGVNLLEFGIPEAMWKLHANDFVAIVTMDAHGNSLHALVEKETGAQLEELQTQR